MQIQCDALLAQLLTCSSTKYLLDKNIMILSSYFSPNSWHSILYFVLAYKTTAEVKVAGKILLNHWSPLWVNSKVGF